MEGADGGCSRGYGLSCSAGSIVRSINVANEIRVGYPVRSNAQAIRQRRLKETPEETRNSRCYRIVEFLNGEAAAILN